MNSTIKVLAIDVVNKIAAGEVIERPASVVKEVVENAIDACASDILVEIENGGIKLIRITDNGWGMNKIDAALAFERHATSKINSVEDLHQISSFGFRGEALPSIASVSKVEIVSKTQEEKSGTFLKLEAGKIIQQKEAGVPQGTKLTVTDLFYNVPARKKFLKTHFTETKHIIDTVTNLAIAHPEISFQLKNDSKTVLNLKKAESLKERLSDLWGSGNLEKFLEIKKESTDPQIYGFIAKPEICKPSRAELYFFVNLRSITSRSLHFAVMEGYKELLPKGKFPWGVLFISINPDRIDVNVHPAKKEVRFQDEREVFHLLFQSVRKSLTSSDLTLPYKMPEKMSEALKKTDFPSVGASSLPEKEFSVSTQSALFQKELHTKSADREMTSVFGQTLKQVQGKQEKTFPETSSGPAAFPPAARGEPRLSREADVPRAYNLWQVANTYIFSQSGEELLVLDQHTAHERILYEETLRNIEENKVFSQQLLFPEKVELGSKQFMTYSENKDLLSKLGFETSEFGGNTILISGVPTLIKDKSGGVFLQEILTQLENETKVAEESPKANLAESGRTKKIASVFACKAAVKSGDKLSSEEMSFLTEKLFTTQAPYLCPHGRPTIIKIPIQELAKRFGRS